MGGVAIFLHLVEALANLNPRCLIAFCRVNLKGLDNFGIVIVKEGAGAGGGLTDFGEGLGRNRAPDVWEVVKKVALPR